MKRQSFPALEQAFAGYLHQDFLCDYPSADAAIADFTSSEPPELVASARKELTQFIQLAQDADKPGQLLLEIGCYYDPLADGMTVVQWLRKVEEMLRVN